VAERPELAGGSKVDKKLVKDAVDAVLKTLSGKTNVDEAWRTYVSKTETVAIKFNGLFRNASTSPQLIWAVCRGLVDAGVAEGKIIVFDRDEKDFKTAGLKPFEDMPKIRFMAAKSGWDAETKAGPFTTRLTRILTKDADAIINLPRLKHHVIAGITMAMKNHTGSIPNARDFHDKIETIAELNALAPIAKKARLAICDAMVGIFNHGPQYRGAHCTWQAKSLLAGTDVVALDAAAAEMLQKARTVKRAGPISPNPTHIAHAAEIGLGTADLKRIELVKA
jgi:uncharacterized protein (DUF362 family)